MTRRSDRLHRVDVDYRILGRTGEQLPPNPENRDMADKNLLQRAIHVQSDLEDFFDTFDITTLVEEDDLTQYITELGELKRCFRSVF